MLRRASDVALFAGCWDVVGGHLEPGEDPAAALRREVHEETGWRVRGIIDRLGPWTWQGDDGRTRTEYDYLITVDGDRAAPGPGRARRVPLAGRVRAGSARR